MNTNVPWTLSAVLLALSACTSTTTVATRDGGAAGGPAPAPDRCFLKREAEAPPPDSGSLALPPTQGAEARIRCVDDAECGAGARCNASLDPPVCQLLFCGPENSICSATPQCEEGLRCEDGVCRSCVCDSKCLVDLTSDRDHCGQCDRKVLSNQTCENGVPTCPADRPTVCPSAGGGGDVCVDTATDPDHCGGCNRPAASGRVCKGGQSACANAQDGLECGTCRFCTVGADAVQCVGGSRCEAKLEGGTRISCNQFCAKAVNGAGTCLEAKAGYRKSATMIHLKNMTCDEVPPATWTSNFSDPGIDMPFAYLACTCSYAPTR